jgi:4-amino-4-deoxy-L-arabinose transferase and related glycosyltransferases of PMT family
MKRLKAVLAAGLAVCLAVFVVRTLWWPFVYDAALIRYANFLMAHHLAPYREIQDYNLPGSYFFDWLVTHTLGVSALAWRVYDLLLMALASITMYRITRPYSRFAGLFAAMLFACFHARDGVEQAGQRDLLIVVLVLMGLALAQGGRRTLRIFLFGLCIGLAATVKPMALVALPLLWLLPEDEDEASTARRNLWRELGVVLGGVVIAPLAALVWLGRMHAVAAFWRTLTVYLPFHAHLGHLRFWPLLTRCITASHGTLLVLALLLAFSDAAFRDTRHELRRLRIFLGAGMVYGLISYLAQGKGYPDHRYPFAAFLFLFAAVEFTYALGSPGMRRVVGVVGLLFATVLSGLSLQRALREHWPAVQVAALTSDLNALGGAALSGRVQCLDTVDGCIETLDKMQIVQSTGFVYDEFLFAAPDSMTAQQAAVQKNLRQEFLREVQSNPPQVMVVMPRLFPSGPYDYAKLGLWPAMERLLDDCYRVDAERNFAAGAGYHRGGYRLYLRRAACTDANSSSTKP